MIMSLDVLNFAGGTPGCNGDVFRICIMHVFSGQGPKDVLQCIGTVTRIYSGCIYVVFVGIDDSNTWSLNVILSKRLQDPFMKRVLSYKVAP